MSAAGKHNHRARGATLILAMIFVLVLSALAVSLASLSGTNVQVAANQRRVNSALYAAQSGLECAKYIVNTVSGSAMTIGGLWGLWDSDPRSFRACFFVALITAGSFFIFRVFQEKMFSR